MRTAGDDTQRIWRWPKLEAMLRRAEVATAQALQASRKKAESSARPLAEQAARCGEQVGLLGGRGCLLTPTATGRHDCTFTLDSLTLNFDNAKLLVAMLLTDQRSFISVRLRFVQEIAYASDREWR